MNLLVLLLFTKVSITWSRLYQPQEILYMEANQPAEISCRSREAWRGDNVYSWYYRGTWGETPTLLINCKNNPNPNKYSCVSGDLFSTGLRIHSAQAEDSGIYHCMFCIRECEFGNGTTLITRNHSPPYVFTHVMTLRHAPLSDAVAHALDESQFLLPDTLVQLTCVVRGARHMLRLTWNISGIRHTGRMITMDDPAGTRTFLNHISIPRDVWDRGEGLSCDVWTHSSVSVHREIPGSDRRRYVSLCSFYATAALTVIVLLALVLSIQLSWIYVP